MAFTTLSAPVSAGLFTRFLSVASGLYRNWQLRREYRQTVHALRALSARDLADIGLSRCAIPGAAREHVYGK